MKEGFWMNWRTGVIVPIYEHERDIRVPTVSKKLCVPKSVTCQFGRFVPELDRNKFLVWLMRKVPLMRVRGHGQYVTFQYAAQRDQLPRAAIRKWTSKMVGTESILMLRIENLQTGKKREMTAKEFLARATVQRSSATGHAARAERDRLTG